MENAQYGGTGETTALKPEQADLDIARYEQERPDEVLSVIGESGRWQSCQWAMLALVGIPLGFNVICINFMAPPTDFWCAPPNPDWDAQLWREKGVPNTSQEKEYNQWRCEAYPANQSASIVSILSRNRTVSCNSWFYNITAGNIISEWDLVCEWEYLQMMAQGVLMLGVVFGVLFWGVIADRFGRRLSLLLACTFSTLSCLLTAAARSVSAFLALRFMSGFCGIGAYIAGFVISMELFGDRWRLLYGTLFCIPMSVAIMAISPMAYYVRYWRHLQVLMALPAVPLGFAYYGFVYESPRWLLSMGRTDEAWHIMKKICVFNNTPVRGVASNRISDEVARAKSPCVRETTWDLLSNCRMLSMTSCLFLCWFVNSLIFYGILLNTTDFGGNVYMNTFLMGLVEVPAYVMCVYVLYRFGRRPPIVSFMIISGVSCLLTLAVEKGVYDGDWPIISLALLGKLAITASFSSIYIYTAELYPTSVRNTGLAICSVGTRLGGILAPFLVRLHPGIPVLTFGCTAIVSGLSILLLPETSNRTLPETIAEAAG